MGVPDSGRKKLAMSRPVVIRMTGPLTESRAYDSAVEYDADGVPRGRGRGAARSGYTSSEREMRQFEDPSTGARIRRESDINLSDILG